MGNGLAFNPATAAERDALVNELSADLFGKGEFGRIGVTLKEKSFVDFCKSKGYDPVVMTEAEKAEAKKKPQAQLQGT